MDMDTQQRLRAVYWAARRSRALMQDPSTVRNLDGERYLTGCTPTVLEQGIDLGRLLDNFARKIGPKRWDKMERWFLTGTAGMNQRCVPFMQMHSDLSLLAETIERSNYQYLIGGARVPDH